MTPSGAPSVRHAVERGMFVREHAGYPDHPPLVFVHGLGESGLCFERIALHHRLDPFPRWIVDLPGYGRSAWTDRVGPLADLADHLVDWIRDRRFGRRPVLVGHSMGGVVALLAAERHPDALGAVVDVDGNKSLEDCAFSGRAAKLSLDGFLGGGFDALVEGIYEKGLRDPAQRGYYASLRLCDPRSYHAHSLELVALSAEERLADRLAALGLPALYIAGQPGGACPRSMELLSRAGVTCVSVGPSGHWPFLDQPDAFAQTLRTFLQAREG